MEYYMKKVGNAIGNCEPYITTIIDWFNNVYHKLNHTICII